MCFRHPNYLTRLYRAVGNGGFASGIYWADMVSEIISPLATFNYSTVHTKRIGGRSPIRICVNVNRH